MNDAFGAKYPRLAALTGGGTTALLDVRLLAVLEGVLGRLDALEDAGREEEVRLDERYCPDCAWTPARHCCRANDHEREASPSEIEARRRMDGT